VRLNLECARRCCLGLSRNLHLHLCRYEPTLFGSPVFVVLPVTFASLTGVSITDADTQKCLTNTTVRTSLPEIVDHTSNFVFALFTQKPILIGNVVFVVLPVTSDLGTVVFMKYVRFAELPV
jgi:hypothetical protein